MLSGAVLNRFHVQCPLARGGMGELWLARDMDPRARAVDVVLKTVRPDLAKDAEVLGSFLREVRVTSYLDHQNVVRHVAHGAWQGLHVLALARIEGKSLAELSYRHGALPLGAALCIARDIAEALSYVHHLRGPSGAPLGVVHGDVSPQNILIDVDGNAHLIDFGAVKLCDDPAGNDIIGKASYLSPEQSRGDAIDARSDQYSLGVVLWELVTGGDLFEDNAARRGRTIPSPSGVAAADLPEALDEAVLRMLAFDPAARFSDTADAGQALAGLARTAQPERGDRDWLAAAARAPRTDDEQVAAWCQTQRTVDMRGGSRCVAAHRGGAAAAGSRA
jgi:serine/threonine protein kinase